MKRCRFCAGLADSEFCQYQGPDNWAPCQMSQIKNKDRLFGGAMLGGICAAAAVLVAVALSVGR